MSIPLIVALAQFKAVIVPTGRFTVRVKVHVCPPMFNAKLAIPLVDGVPVME